MLKKIFAVALLATIIVSCKKKKDAFNYNQELVTKENSMIPAIQAGESSISEYYTAGNYDSVYAIGDRLEKLVQSKIEEVDAMKTPDAKEAENFKASYIKAFKSLKLIYTTYKEIGKAESDEDRQKIVDGLQKMVDEKNEFTRDMQAAQRKYASANGFKVQ